MNNAPETAEIAAQTHKVEERTVKMEMENNELRTRNNEPVGECSLLLLSAAILADVWLKDFCESKNFNGSWLFHVEENQTEPKRSLKIEKLKFV